jgi:Ser/Thr protein kinase RdoA (MazF antagonist)
MQLIHRDAHPGNMLFLDGELSGWLDFEIMVRGPRLFDLCYCSTSLLIYGFDDPVKRQAWHGLVRALVEGYDQVSPLTPVERGSIRLMQMCIEVIFISWFAHNNFPAPATRNIEALAWLYENPYEL